MQHRGTLEEYNTQGRIERSNALRRWRDVKQSKSRLMNDDFIPNSYRLQ